MIKEEGMEKYHLVVKNCISINVGLRLLKVKYNINHFQRCSLTMLAELMWILMEEMACCLTTGHMFDCYLYVCYLLSIHERK